MANRIVSRRDFLRGAAYSGVGVGLGALVQACQPVAPSAATTSESVSANTSESAELELWHHWGGDREPLLNQAITEFSGAHPGVTVEATLIPWERKEETVLTAVAAGDAPDVLHLIGTETPVYAVAGALIPLDDYIAAAGLSSDDAIPVDWKAGIVEDKLWALPLNSAGADHMLFYNKQHFEDAGLDPEKPPLTWNEMKEYAQTLLRTEGDNITRLGVELPASGWEWLYFLAQNGAEWLSEDSRQVLMDNDRAVESLQYVVDVYDIQGGWEKVQAYLSMGLETSPFVAGASSIYTSGTWVNFYITAGNPDLPYATGLAPNNREPWHAGTYGPQQWVIPVGTAHPQVAFELALWLSQDSGGCGFLAPQEMPSAWKGCNDANNYAETVAYWPTIEATFETTRSEPATPLFNKFLSIWDEMLQKALLHASTPGEAVTWGAEEMTKANNEYWETR